MRTVVFLVIISLLPIGIPVSIAEKPRFIFAYTEKEGFPYYMGTGINVPKNNPGISIELLHLIEKEVPIKAAFQRLPWKRCLMELEKGTVSALGASYKPEREKIGVYPRTSDGTIDSNRRTMTETYALYTLKDSKVRYNPQTNSFNNLDHHKGLVAPLGFSIVDDLKKSGNIINENSGSVYSLLQMLVLNRVDGIVSQEESTGYFLRKHSELFGSIIKTEPTIKTKHYYIVISHQFYNKHPKLSEQIWDTLGNLRKTKLTELIDKYYLLTLSNSEK